jgi:anti-sigma regulatory factor (Ser/Thr protein kinase)
VELRPLVLCLPAEPVSVPDARRAVSDHLSELGFAKEQLDPVRLGVSEAVGNAVRHAYPQGAHGDVEVEVSAYGDRIRVQVRDWGCGRTGAAAKTRGAGFGTPLMDAVSGEFVVSDRRPRGTEVSMTFPLV